ncbi:RING-H2 finger protein ATL33-like [Pogonomyrmex barbatus]|uniref:RING-H2 finger protein ATL33-like n=1 Tax=Pogonomyrmex barbatus TaxID=144034 RepID=A0A6I9XFY4_9HYME|nr:RING-H2 finger protein ATL33-like [Pogonomyrmex barbatus]
MYLHLHIIQRNKDERLIYSSYHAYRLNVMKMTYPGLVLLVGVGVGIATFLYYVFTENNHAEEQPFSYSRNRRSSEDRFEDRSWSTSHSDENVLLNRRNSSSSSKNKEKKDLTSKDDINICSICQYALIDSDIIQLRPCRHKFHKSCIIDLTRHNPGALCPNCRRKFKAI